MLEARGSRLEGRGSRVAASFSAGGGGRAAAATRSVSGTTLNSVAVEEVYSFRNPLELANNTRKLSSCHHKDAATTSSENAYNVIIYFVIRLRND